MEFVGLDRLVDPHQRFAQIYHVLGAIVLAAADRLPAGWQIEFAGGLSGDQTRGSFLSLDLRLITPRGRRLPCRSVEQRGDLWETYRRLADLVFSEMHELFPELEGQGYLAWGGKWTGEDGSWQIGHFDLAGWRGHGRYQRPPQRTHTVTAEGPESRPYVG